MVAGQARFQTAHITKLLVPTSHLREELAITRVYFSSQLRNGEGNILLVYENSRALATREMMREIYRSEMSCC